ncbi:MAG TPA: bifunctional 2-keto-4-hydroxyglutarate aldolase/2-keto-3-deoxy-6-phosphogluconate aldolase [Bacillota bacterium]|nr:bifunctional 2-keto-4-hydroxyglutarate aldolase/2-keto-3-deoxy-6-phosphogluconate aldolase [Bacillota bacterium]
MDKEIILSKISECGLVAVVRAESGEQAIKIAEACAEAGVAGIEITFTVPGAAEVIRDCAKNFNNGKIIIGAGTVMDSETARTAILAGAQYIVSPYLDVDTVKTCNRYRVPVMPGAMTIKEVVEAMQTGADVVKVFPGELFGPSFIKAVRGPIPYAKMMPTGGVSLENVHEWIKAGAVAVGVGSNLTGGAKTGDYASITRIAKDFIAKIKEARSK